MIREIRLNLIMLHDIVFWTFIAFDHINVALSVQNCIHILKEPKAKTSICTNLDTRFDRIPEKFPDHVAELIIENQKISVLDSAQLKSLPNLVNLTLNNNEIQKIVPNTFTYVPQLISLRLSGNNIYLKEYSMPSSSLIYLKNLHTLDLSKNPLGFVPDYYFQLLKQLKILNLSTANKGFYIETNGFYGLTNLQILDLTNNHFSTLSESLSPSLSAMQLQEFYLFQNPWNCDCNLQWLKVWFSSNKVKYTKDLNKEFPTNEGRVFSDLQPKCRSPLQLRDKNIFSDSTNVDSIRINDLKCVPKIFTQDKKIEIAKDQSVNFTCEFHANPGGSVTWSRNGNIVQNHWRRVSWNRSQGIKFKAWLTLQNAEESDSGNWRCILTTHVGTVNATFTLKVISPQTNIDFKSILKYVGIGAVTLILLLVVIGIIIYCVYGFQIQNNRRPIKSSTNTLIDDKETPVKQNLGNYHIISKSNKDLELGNKILISPVDKGQYYNAIIETNNSFIQPCLEQSHSPFSHYLVNGSTSICPLHGEVNKQKSQKFDDVTDNAEKKLAIQIPLSDSGAAQSTSIPCPIHGDVLSYLSCPVSSMSPTNHNFNSPCLTSSTISKPSKEYVLRVTSSNPIAVVTPDSLSKDIKYLSSGPAATSFSFSTAI